MMTQLLRNIRTAPEPLLDETIAVVGLGYVGLPLATALSRSCRKVIGFDIDPDRIAELRVGVDRTKSVAQTQFISPGMEYSNDCAALAGADVFIITVPTPVGADNQPDLTALKEASATIGRYLKPGDLVICESTVYPGATEEVCAAILAGVSGLTPGVDFSIGYSPERINPGDQKNTLESTAKIIAGDTVETQDRMARIYRTVVGLNLYRAPCIRTAEMAKVLENTQRDLNIALANETAKICALMGIETHEVIDAAASKWNFVAYEPGLVGGHCIGVDPYYLISRAENLGGNAKVIRAGREVNEGMAAFILERAISLLDGVGLSPKSARIGFFGISYKQDVPDLRNSKALDVIRGLRQREADPMVFDPVVSESSARSAGIELLPVEAATDLDLRIVAVPHSAFFSDGWRNSILSPGILMDVKSMFRRQNLPEQVMYWSL